MKSSNLTRNSALIKNLLFLGIVFCSTGCRKDIKPESNIETPGIPGTKDNAASVSLVPGDHYVAAGNASNGKLEIYDTSMDINLPAALFLSWKPTTALGYTSTEVGLWDNGDPEGDPMDAKIRTTSYWSGNTSIILAAGGQLVTAATYPGGVKKWARNVGAGQYPHGAELLPDGNIAVAASHGNWVRVYNTTSGATNYASYTFTTPHQVLWDPEYNCLWAIGATQLIKFTVGGTKTSPTLTAALIKTIPGNGHDLSAVYSNNNKLWFSNSNNVYIYDKPSNTYVTAPGSVNKTKVKAISDQPSGQIIETRPSTACTLNTWSTPSIDIYNAAGTFIVTRTKTGACFYKAKVWNPLQYEPLTPPAAPIANGKYKIVNRRSGKAIAVDANSLADGAPLVQWTYATTPNKEWNITQIGTSGYYRITNVNSGKDMNITSASYLNGAQAIQWPYSASAPKNDEWYIEDVGSGYYKIVSRYSGKVLNVEAASLLDGANIIQYTYTTVPQSEWEITLVP